MSEIISESFKTNLKIMKFFHYYPPEENGLLYKLVALLMYIMFVIPVPTLGILYLLTEKNLDMDRVNYNAGFLIQTVGVSIKLLPFIKNGYRIRKCIDFFESAYFIPIKDTHKKLVNECITTCQRNTKIFLLIVFGGVSSWATKPFFWKGRNLPVDLWLPFDFTQNLVLYYSVYLFVASGVILTSFSTGALDPLIAGLADQATTQFKILKDNLEHLIEYVEEDCNGSFNEIMYKSIISAVNHQNEILEFLREFENCFSPIMLSQITSSVFVLCYSCLQLSKIDKFGYYALQLLLYFGVILGEVCFYCFYGTNLIEESNSIVNAIYMGTWYNYDIKSKKALLTIMERSKQPVTVKIGIILDMSLVTFTMILRRSYSLLAVLKNYE